MGCKCKKCPSNTNLSKCIFLIIIFNIVTIPFNRFQSPAPSKQPVKAPEVQQYYYVQPTAQPAYSTEPTNYYQSEYSKQQSQAPQPQYYTTNEQQQYQDYYQGSEEQQYVTPKLLTNENYPTSKHTRVVFRTKSGKLL